MPVAKVHCLTEEMAQRAGCILQRKTGLKSDKDIWVNISKCQCYLRIIMQVSILRNFLPAASGMVKGWVKSRSRSRGGQLAFS